MQTYTLYFTATFDLPIQAASREAAQLYDGDFAAAGVGEGGAG